MSGASPFSTGIYPVPDGLLFGRSPIAKFTGEPSSGPLSGASGLIFFSASLLDPSSANSVDFVSVEVAALATDRYFRPQERSSRLFRFGGGPGFGASNLSRTNATLYRTQPIEYTAVATLVQTTPPGPTTVIKIP
jgi:hypothetical protein